MSHPQSWYTCTRDLWCAVKHLKPIFSEGPLLNRSSFAGLVISLVVAISVAPGVSAYQSSDPDLANTSSDRPDGNNGEKEEGPVPPLPQPDPRYPLSEVPPDFVSPPEILEGGFPAEEPWISDQVQARSANGLDSDRAVVAALLVESDAQEEVQTYGLVVSKSEREVLDEVRSRDALALKIKTEAAALVGWAGSRNISDADRRLQTLEFMVTAESVGEARLIVDRFGDQPFTIEVIEVRHSWRELRSIAAFLEDRRTYEDELASTGFSTEDRDKVRKSLAAYDVTSFGYSIDRNTLIAYSENETVKDRELVVVNNELAVEVTPLKIDPTEGVDPCNQQGCAGPTRAGLSAERTGHSSNCTLGFAIIDNGDEDYSTAGHCSGPGRDTHFSNETGSTLFAYLSFGRDVPLATTGSDWFVAGSTIDAEELNELDFLVSNRLYTSGSNGVRITGTVAQLAVSIHDDVCKSGQSTSYTCGEIVDIGDDANPAGISISDQYRSDYWSSGGDSGAPVIWQNNLSLAVSIHGGGPTGNKYSGPVENFAIEDPGTVIFTTTDKRRDYVQALYVAALGRHADGSGYNYWRNTVLSSCSTPKARAVADGLLLSAEFRNKYPLGSTLRRQIRVEKAYWAMLGRPSDSGGLTHWTNFLTNESRWTSLIAAFGASPEFNIRVWSGASAFDGDIC